MQCGMDNGYVAALQPEHRFCIFLILRFLKKRAIGRNDKRIAAQNPGISIPLMHFPCFHTCKLLGTFHGILLWMIGFGKGARDHLKLHSETPQQFSALGTGRREDEMHMQSIEKAPIHVTLSSAVSLVRYGLRKAQPYSP